MFKSDLVFFPAGKIEDKEINQIRYEITEFAKLNDINKPIARHKPHLLIPSIYNISLKHEIIDNVEKFVGNKCMLWYSVLFNKQKKTQSYIPWHYDDYFWNLKGNGCTVWIALEDIVEEMGPMQFALDYEIQQYEHQTNNDINNILIRGNISNYKPKNEVKIITSYLKKGEYSIHSNKVMHRSGYNTSNKDRLAFALRYIDLSSIPESFKIIKRGIVTKNKITKYYYLEKAPDKVTKILGNKDHLKSFFTSLLITFFGDKKRTINKKINDFFRFIFSRKMLIYFSKNKK